MSVMNMGISRWAIDHPTPVILLFALLSLMGVASYLQLPLGGMPRVELPIVEVRVDQPGATPTELEGNVARKIEGALSGLAGLRHQTTEITEGSVSVVAEFVLEADLDRATQDVREAILRVRPELPGSVTEPVVTRVDISGGVQLSYAVRSDAMSPVELTRRIDEEIIPALLAVDGVQQALRRGGSRREFRVELEPERLAAYGLGLDSVFRQLQGAEANLPGGAVRDSGGDRSIRITGASLDAAALAARSIALGDGAAVRLDEIARVFDAGSVSEGYALLDGRQAVVIEIAKSRGASETDMAEGVAEVLESMEKGADALRFELFNDAVQYTRENFVSARDTLIEGAVLTVLVVLLFLRSWRATLVAALAIPFSLLPTFIAMSALGFTLNIISLLALILVIGILVDDAIVEVENIERHIERGEPPREAARNGADAIGLAVVAITLTIVAVFLPVSFIKGVVGQYFREFGLTASVAVLASLLVARLLTPILCAWLLRPRKHAEPPKDPAWVVRYGRMLEWTLHHRKTTVLITVGVLAATLGLVAMIPTGFLPKSKPNTYQVSYRFAPGITPEAAARRGDDIRRALAPMPDVRHVFVTDNGSGFAGNASVVLQPRDQRQADNESIEREIRTRLGQLTDVRAELLLGDGVKEMTLSFRSDDAQALETFVRQLTLQAKALPGLKDVDSSVPLRRPGYDLRIDTADAARLGVVPQDIADMLTIATLSGLDSQLPRVPVGTEQVPVRTRIAGGDRLDPERLLDLPIRTEDGRAVPLRSIATLAPNETAASIKRLNRERVVDLSANLDGLTLSQAMEKIRALPAYQQMPAQVRFAEYGEAQYMDEMFTQFGLAVLLGLCAVYAVLVLLFHDWLQPLTIMFALPLALGGAAAALLLGGHSLNLSTVIGLLMLFGIVGKNSILLVDYIVEARAEGVERDPAVLRAGHERVRPILMTTVAMVGGMIPAAVGFGHDDGFRAPMAIAVIGGLIASTLLSLLLVPMFYTLIDDLEHKLFRRRKPAQAQGATA